MQRAEPNKVTERFSLLRPREARDVCVLLRCVRAESALDTIIYIYIYEQGSDMMVLKK